MLDEAAMGKDVSVEEAKAGPGFVRFVGSWDRLALSTKLFTV